MELTLFRGVRPMNRIITMSDPHDPKEIRGWHDGSRAGFTTDPRRAKPFPTRREAQTALGELRQRFPSQALHIQARLGPRMVGFAAGLALAGWLATTSRFLGLTLVLALGACSVSPAEVQQREHLACQGYGFTSGTREFSSCLMFVDQARLNRIAVEDAAGNAHAYSMGTSVPDYSDMGQSALDMGWLR
jgi:hypothetical protein